MSSDPAILLSLNRGRLTGAGQGIGEESLLSLAMAKLLIDSKTTLLTDCHCVNLQPVAYGQTKVPEPLTFSTPADSQVRAVTSPRWSKPTSPPGPA